MTSYPSTFDNELHSLTDQERRARTATERLQRSDRSVLDQMSSTFIGTLTELAETAAPVTVLTRNESSIRGTIEMAGAHVVVLSSHDANKTVLIQLQAIEGLVEPGQGHGRSISAAANNETMADVLDLHLETGTRVGLTLASNNRVMGCVAQLGRDQIALTLDGSGEMMTIPTRAIDQVVINT